MSSRALKKLTLQNCDFVLAEECTTDDSDDQMNSSHVKINRYDLLLSDESEKSEVLEDGDNESTDSINVQNELKNDIKRKRKKNKKKRKNKPSNTRNNDDDALEDPLTDEDLPNECPIVNEKPTKPGKNNSMPDMSFLKIESRYLNPDNELKRIFGTKTVGLSSDFKRKNRSRTARNFQIVIPKDKSIMIPKQGLTMKLIEKNNIYKNFSFEHDIHYQKVQRSFLQAASTMNQDYMVDIIYRHPYHVDALVQLSDLCQFSEEHAMAAELNERAIQALESAFHPQFNICRGDCRLTFQRQENRSFYVALLKHIKFVGQKACYRTALELCKMLLSLNPLEDPIAIILAMDYYALRSKEYKWFIEFTNAWDPYRNLLQLPNFKYSIAVAHFYLNNMEEADTCLEQALMLFPSFLMLLVDKCGIQMDSKTQTHPFFTTNAESTQSPSLKSIISLYIERCESVWRDKQILTWLEKNVLIVLRMVEVKNPFVDLAQQNRCLLYKPLLPDNIKRHLVILDMAQLMGEGSASTSSNSSVFVFDPYPPSNSNKLYTIAQRAVPTRTVPSTGILSSFLSTLNPNVHFEERNNVHQQNRDDVAGAAAAVDEPVRITIQHDFRNGFNGVVEAIRGILTLVGEGEALTNQLFDVEGGVEEITIEADIEDSDSSQTPHNTNNNNNNNNS